MYKTGDMIRAITWHPYINEALIVGSANGDINKLKLSPMGGKVEDSYVKLTCHSCQPGD